MEQKYSAGDLIYDIGTKSEVFYILKVGRLAVEQIIEIEDQNVYPIGKHKWETMKTKRTILYKVREIEPGEIFGYEEIIKERELMNDRDDLDKEISVSRKQRVSAIT
eukprot:CAMPEP_0170560942 /NCGR_PEP_ID=MMETSP0211-20121228/51864_1 /TAXON_ID=311385 /ORGANISM="Pseudokeronopsis sp., Strain OXSARD2" /LENGTH=106 /DNA_ID=CAMNT_0010875817 /DNA_START=100 /DNA_END=420 /DNA_ORIENTATION=+